MKKVLFVLLICTLLLSSFALAKEFPDVASTHWAYNYINELSNRGVINGYEDGTYRPNGTVTRAEFLKLMVCTDETRVSLLDDLENMYHMKFDTWYEKYTKISSKILKFKFDDNMNDPVNRLEMARIIKDFAVYDKISNSGSSSSVDFNDVKLLSPNDQNTIIFVRDLGIINGYEDDSFRPTNNMTRAEVSAVILRYTNQKGS